MYIRLLLFSTGLVSLIACGDPASDASGLASQQTQSIGPSSGGSFGINTGALPEGCIKIEDPDLGVEGLELELDGQSIIISDWITKEGSADEYIGFSYETELCGFLSVKSGRDIHVSELNGSWCNPNGSSGPSAKAISNIVFCSEPCPPPPPPPEEPPPEEPPPEEPPHEEPYPCTKDFQCGQYEICGEDGYCISHY